MRKRAGATHRLVSDDTTTGSNDAGATSEIMQTYNTAVQLFEMLTVSQIEFCLCLPR